MKSSVNEALKSISAGKFKPVYFIYGEEAYYIDKIADLLESKVLPDEQKAFNFMVFYGKDSSMSTILQASRRFPIGCDHQLIIVKEAQQITNWDQLEGYLTHAQPSTILVFCHKYKSPDKRLKLFKTLESSANVCYVDSPKVKDKDLPAFINDFVAHQNRKIAPQAVAMLVENVGTELETLASGLIKVILSTDENALISEVDIEKQIGISREFNVQSLIKALTEKNLVQLFKAVKYIEQNLKTVAFPMITGGLFSHFSKSLLMENQADIKEYGMQSWMMKDLETTAKNYRNKLPIVISTILEYDMKFKGYKNDSVPQEELFKELMYKIVFL